LFVWLSTSGMRLVGRFRRFDVEQLKRPRHLRSRSDRSRRKPESALAHSAGHKDEIHHEHNREQVGKPASALAASGVGVETAQSLTGHSSLEMHRLYTHPDVEVKRKAIALLPDIPTKARARR